MSYTFFTNEIVEPSPYLLLSVFHNDKKHCGSYYNDRDGEYIVSIETGEKFLNLYDFFSSIKGFNITNADIDCRFYDEKKNEWLSVYCLYK